MKEAEYKCKFAAAYMMEHFGVSIMVDDGIGDLHGGSFRVTRANLVIVDYLCPQMLRIHGNELVHRCLPTLLCCIGNGVLADGLA